MHENAWPSRRHAALAASCFKDAGAGCARDHGRVAGQSCAFRPGRPQFEREQQRASVIRRHQQTRDILAMLRARWPALFTTPVPLAVGVMRAIRAELGEGSVTAVGLSRALHYWTDAPGYLAAIAAGEMRRNLDGTEAGLPDEAQRRFAGETLERHAARRVTRPGSRPPRPSPSRAQAEAVLPEASGASQS